MADSLYLTTAIPFVNAAPHLGHALELVQADAIARHARARGRPVHLVTGTDEHAPKNAFAAEAAGQPVAEFVDRNARRFRSLATSLGLSNDDFIRTSVDPRHRPTVEAIWRACATAGDLRRAPYGGWYCAGCEEFVEAVCDEHDAPPEWVHEENWYFRLSRYATQIRELIVDGRLRIVPPERRNEVLAFLDGDVRDISVSRSRSRARDWGIPVPGDPTQIIYVWFDALVNYVSAAPPGWWIDAVDIRHVIGKGIVRFHAVVWPAILLSAGRPIPDELFVHDYVTASGRKIGKSLGNAVDPGDLVARYGADAVRWWLLREVPRVGEADFTESRLVETANRDLANGVGNLVQRVVGLDGSPTNRSLRRSRAGPGRQLSQAHVVLQESIDAAVADFDLRAATGAITAEIDAVNREIEQSRPWALSGEARVHAVDALVRRTGAIVAELAPFVPDLAARAAARLAGGVGPPLFARFDPVAI
jgi:methionyl-tRNA synthetase